MREILFRGKRKDNSEWVEGCYTKYHAYFAIPTPVIENADYDYEVIRETVGQYTGLTDKNGTKIFEGDILAIYENGIQSQIASVIYKDCAFRLSYYCIKLSSIRSVEIEVIGNTHDNPELLKGGANDEE